VSLAFAHLLRAGFDASKFAVRTDRGMLNLEAETIPHTP